MAFPHIRTSADGPVTEADLDRLIAAKVAKPLPAGCDQQGRYPTRPRVDRTPTRGTGTTQQRPGLGLALIALPWLLVIVAWAVVARIT